MPKLHIRDLVIEVTRECQLECEHCLRGDSESVYIKEEYIEKLLKNVGSIGSLTITGGEPFLNVKAIDYIIKLILQYDIPIEFFFIATNGIIFEDDSDLSRKGLLQIIKLYNICFDKSMCSIRISNTKWHGVNTTNDNLLHAFSFTHYDGEDWLESNIIPEGRGVHVSISDRQVPTNPDPTEEPSDLMVYLNAKGRVLFECNLSYDTQDEDNISIEEAIEIIHKCIALEKSECAT